MQLQLFIKQAADFNQDIVLLNNNITPIDLTGKSLVGYVKKSVGSSQFIEFDYTITDATGGAITLTLDATSTATFQDGIYIYNVYSRDIGTLDNETEVLYGNVKVSGSATNLYTPANRMPKAYPPVDDLLFSQDVVSNDQTDDDSRPVSAGVAKRLRDIIDALNLTGDPLEVEDIINDLTTGGSDAPLSAEQGVALKNLVDLLDTNKQNADQTLDDLISNINWNNQDMTFDIDTGVGPVIQVGQEVLVKVRNVTGDTITNGQVVKISGASGQRPTVELAQGDSSTNSKGILGIATSDITDNSNGFITIHGLVRDLDTSGYSEGDSIYLSGSTAGLFEQATLGRPIILGTVTYSHANNGTVFVAVENETQVMDFGNDPTTLSTFNLTNWLDSLGIVSIDGGGQLGTNATVTTGGAIGKNSSATSGFAGGSGAVSSADLAVQLGLGENSTFDTIQFKNSGPVTETQFGYLGNMIELPLTPSSADSKFIPLNPVVDLGGGSSTAEFQAWSNESSTFTSWGSTMEAFPRSTSIAVNVRSWDASNLISKVRIRILESNNSKGKLLFDETQNVTTTHNVEKLVEFQFSEILGGGNRDYFLEIWTNNLMGWNRSIREDGLTKRRKYSTSKTAIDTVGSPPWASATDTTYVSWYQLREIYSVDPDILTATADANRTPLLDSLNMHTLKGFNRKLGRIEAGANTLLKIGILGDSWTNGDYRLYTPFRDNIANAGHSVAGWGWVDASDITTTVGGITRSKTGSWVDDNSSATSLGPVLSHTVSGAGGDILGFSDEGEVTDWVIHYRTNTNGGSFKYRNGAGGWSSDIDTNSASSHQTINIASVTGDLSIEVVTQGSTGVTILGVEALIGTSGIVVNKLGKSGSRVLNHIAPDETTYKDAIGALNLDIVYIVLGTNDMSANDTPEDYVQNLTVLADRIREASDPTCDIVFVSPSHNGLTGRTYAMDEYARALESMCQINNEPWINLIPSFGDYTDDEGYTFLDHLIYGDSAHPNTSGGRIISKVLYDKTFRYL